MKNFTNRRLATYSQWEAKSLKTATFVLFFLLGISNNLWAQCTPPPQAPTVTPSNYTPCIGSSIQVTVTNMYLPNTNWTASLILTGGSMPITSNGTYTIPVNNSGNLYVYIQNNVNNCPNVYQSSPVAINAIPSNKPSAQSDTVVRFCPGDNKFLFVTSPNSASTFQWKKNGVNIGTNNDTLFLNNLTAADTGSYKCFISSSCPTDSSKTIKLKVGSIESQSGNLSLCVGSQGQLWVNAPSANGFVWKLNGVVIANSNNDTLFINNYSTAQAGTYTCEATQNGGCLSTAMFTIVTNTVTTTFDFSGLIASYPMQNNANNAVSTSYNGIVNTGCALSTDRNGNANRAYSFDGSNNATINMGDISAINGASQLTISGWFKRNNLSRNDELFSKVIDSAGIFSRVYGSNLYAYNTFGNNTSAYAINAQGTNWFHYLITFNAGTLTTYINGASVGTVTNAAKPTIQSATGSSFILGDIVGGGTAAYPSVNLLGTVDEINIFNRMLSTIEISTIANTPQFVQHPTSVAVCSGNTLSLSVIAEDPTVTYQWKKGGANIIGANSATYIKANVQAADAGSYTCYITRGCNSSNSIAATVTISSNTTTITSQPQALSKCIGQPATFSITATGGTSYQWKKNGVVLSGQTSATLNIAAVALSDTGTYTCDVLGGSCGTLTSTGAYLTVNSNPVVTISPASPAVCAGSPITLTASGAASYSWSNSGGTSVSATFSPNANTTYSVTALDASGCSATASKSVTVNSLPSAFMSFTSSPFICPGTSITANATGGGTYSWSNGGGTNSSATFSPNATTTYTVTVTNSNNCTATASNVVTVKTVTAITTQPQSQTTCSGGAVTLAVVANGANLSYQWKKNGTAIGTNQSSFSIASATVADAGTYTVDVTGDCGVVMSSDAIVTIVGSLQISQQPIAVNSCAGTNAILTVVANGANVNYSWTKNGTAIANSNNDTLYLNNLSTANAGSYVCNITSNCGNATSNTVTVTVKQATTSTQSLSVCYGGSIVFNGATLTQSGTYKDTLTNAAGCDSIITLNFVVRARIEKTINAAICTGQTYSFNGAQLSQSGVYLDTLLTTAGCDSFITLNLSVNSFVTGNITAAICQGSAYPFNGQNLTQAGQYTDTLLSVAGCDSILTLVLTVNPLPQPTISQNGFVLTVSPAFSSYQWQLNSGNITNATSQSHTATQNGSYTVSVTDANGCSATSNSIFISNVGIEEMNAAAISIFPNPIATYTTIAIANSNIVTDKWSYSLKDINGKTVLIGNNMKHETLIDCSTLASGTYFLHISDGGATKVYKLLKISE